MYQKSDFNCKKSFLNCFFLENFLVGAQWHWKIIHSANLTLAQSTKDQRISFRVGCLRPRPRPKNRSGRISRRKPSNVRWSRSLLFWARLNVFISSFPWSFVTSLNLKAKIASNVWTQYFSVRFFFRVQFLKIMFELKFQKSFIYSERPSFNNEIHTIKFRPISEPSIFHLLNMSS